MRRAVAAAMVLAGVLALADAALTLAWQEPVSALRARAAQPRLRAELRALELAVPGPSGTQRRAAVAPSARAVRRRTHDGAAVARLRIPRIGLDAVVVRGTRPDDLERAPGLLDTTALPGERGTVAIAGHRTTYGAPFRHLDRLRRGDRLTVAMPYATLRYAVEGGERPSYGRPSAFGADRLSSAVFRRSAHRRLRCADRRRTNGQSSQARGSWSPIDRHRDGRRGGTRPHR
jgi:sortase (surface protein transpeptidase)